MRFPAGSGVTLCLVGMLPAVFGQAQKGANNSTSGANGSVVTLPSGAQLPAGFQATPQFIAGKVVMDDGAPPPDGVLIERVCGSVAHTEGRTDQKGGFGFEMGHDDMVQDASYSGNAVINPNHPVISSNDLGADPNRPYRNCEIRGNLAGYRSESISLSTYKPGENTNIGTILLHKLGPVDGSVISATSAAAPRNAAREFAKGLDEVKKGKPTDAAQSFGKAVELYPQYAEAWLELGQVQMSLRQSADAEKSFQAAIRAEPKFLKPYVQLSQLEFQSRKWQELADVTDQLFKLDAFETRERYYNGLANYTMKRMDAAEKSLRDTIQLDTGNQFPKAHQFLAAILVTKKDFGGAEAELRNYLKLAPAAPDAANVRRQLEGLEKAAGPAGK